MAELATLFATSFVAATLVPLPSEAALAAYIHIRPHEAALGWLPLVGDALCVAAGRLARYAVVAAVS